MHSRSSVAIIYALVHCVQASLPTVDPQHHPRERWSEQALGALAMANAPSWLNASERSTQQGLRNGLTELERQLGDAWGHQFSLYRFSMQCTTDS